LAVSATDRIEGVVAVMAEVVVANTLPLIML
jgi:hypothetical protein